jgi:hypothetical protein
LLNEFSHSANLSAPRNKAEGKKNNKEIISFSAKEVMLSILSLRKNLNRALSRQPAMIPVAMNLGDNNYPN